MQEIRRSPWECLHRDVIESILDRLVLLSDLIRFGAVCKSWNCLSLNYYREKRILGLNNQLPWLVVRPIKEGRDEHNLYNLTCSKIIKFQFEFDRDRHLKSYYRGSSHGWLFVIQKDYELLMFKPISEISFRLPPLNLKRTEGLYEGTSFTSNFFGSLTLSRDPSTCFGSQPFEVLVASSSFSSNFIKFDVMAHWKSGDGFWTCSQNSSKEEDDGEYGRYFFDFIFYKGRMLAMSARYSRSTGIPQDGIDVISISIDNSGGFKIKKVASTPILDGLHGLEGHLVETTKGELLMVHKYTHHKYSSKLKTFRVYKVIICPYDSAAKIIPIKNLGGECLFLGKHNHGISVLASNYPACIPNSIRYATFFSQSSSKLEVFNMEDESISYSFLPSGYEKVPCMPWVVPSMQL
ncbi:hypothetical protein FNV43_RR26061 [Rhamnella rubrinervis]|uniref:F-box protein n=1 Tax=Rhamnella rubrinervis TaxID=2594499 RepID=A0A8K0DI48_9ROSA|nr:hypothetical protein FNV43_RR26061 [Rhamnella rubrinervis]